MDPFVFVPFIILMMVFTLLLDKIGTAEKEPKYCPHCGQELKLIKRSETSKCYHHTGMGSEYLGESTSFWSECASCERKIKEG